MDNLFDAAMARIEVWFLPEHVPISPQAIDEFEKESGCNLPADYRHFLQKYGLSAGRGYPTFPKFGKPATPDGGVEVFYGFNPAHSRDLLRHNKRMKGRLPDNMLAVAESPGGEICLCVAGTQRGQVFWWDRTGPSSNPAENVKLIAQDWGSFINSLDKDSKWNRFKDVSGFDCKRYSEANAPAYWFAREVAEIGCGKIEMKAIARKPRYRTKLALHCQDPSVDCISICVGPRGIHIKNVVDALGGERVDLVRWHELPEKFIANALLPGKVEKVALDHSQRRAVALAKADQAADIDGKQGLNRELASELTGWQIDIESEP